MLRVIQSKIELFMLHVANFSSYIKFQNHARVIGISASLVFAVIMGMVVFPVQGRTSVAEAASGTASSTTITLTKANADLTLSTTSSDGTFASSTAEEMAQFGVKTTNYTGYTLTIEASDDTGTLTNTDTSITTNNTFSSINSVMDENTFDDNAYNGKWGYKPSKMKSVENVGFWPSPTTTATTLDVTESANPSTDNDYNIVIGARADYSQSTGTYSKTMTLHATANPSTYSITYLDNTGDTTVKNLPDITTSTTSNTSIPLSRVTPSRDGYAFAGWCDQAPTSGGTVCSGNTYAVSDNYPIDQTTANYIMLYATWEIPTQDIVIKTIEGIASVSLNGTSCTTTSGCVVSGLETGQSYELSATPETGQSFGTWSNNGSGSIDDVTSNPTTYTVGEGSSTIIPTTSSSTLSTLTVTFDDTFITGVQIRTEAGADGGTLLGTISTSGGSIDLVSGEKYYLYPLFESEIRRWGGWSNTSDSGYIVCDENSKSSITSDCINQNIGIIIGARGAAVSVTASGITGLRDMIASMEDSTGNVYTYDAATYGAASDANNNYPIYIKKSPSDKYPGYVRLGGNSTSSTCWRIVRTTGSGGIKMVYVGNWTGSACTTDGYIAQSAFNSNMDKSIVGVGYTYNANYKNTTATTAAGTLFGTNSNYSGNSTSSTIKSVIDSWYANNLASWGSHLEGSAGYCNDRSVGPAGSYTWDNWSDSTSIDYPYSEDTLSGAIFYFGHVVRSKNKKYSLNCPRSIVDLYTTSGSPNGNRQLSYPIALLTEDERALSSNSGTTLSPYWRFLGKSYMEPYYLLSDSVNVNPAISLSPGAKISSGIGTASNPWEVTW